jgi:hypothetical protein
MRSLVAHAENPPPDYIPPAAVLRPFAAAHVDVEVVDRRPPPAADAVGDAAARSGVLAPPRLARVLSTRLEPVLGRSGAAIVLRVDLIEAGVGPAGVRAVVDVGAEAGGVRLASTRGTSTLRGLVRAGMTDMTADVIEAAVIDAFERSVLRPAFIDAVNAGMASRPGTPPTAVAETVDAWTVDVPESKAAAHVVSAVFDGGKSYAFGVRYLHDHLYGSSGILWGGYGVEARFTTQHFERLDAVAGLAVLHAGMGLEQGFSVEVGLGPGGLDAVRPVGVAGVYLSFYYIDLGFTFQFVIAPTPELDGLTGPNFGVRINLPLKVHDKSVRCRSPLHCSVSLLPGFNDPPADSE